MQRLKNLRVQLNYLRDYLFTCREPVIEQFKKFIWPKDYMYEHIHQYSIAVSILYIYLPGVIFKIRHRENYSIDTFCLLPYRFDYI